MDTTQNDNEFLEGDSNSRENFENKWNWPEEIKYGKDTAFIKNKLKEENDINRNMDK